MTFYIYIHIIYIYITMYIYNSIYIYITYRIQPVETMIHWWLCALLAGIGHTVKITMFALEKSKNRKVEKSKSSHARRFRLEKSKNSKKSKSRKVEKSKSSKDSKNSKSRKVENFLVFWFFAKIFPGRVINPVGLSTHRAFYGCLVALSRSNGWLLSRGAGNLQSVYQN